MANSINTNYGALIALQNLNATNKALETTQNRVNTGLKIANAKDNGAIWAIAQSQTADMKAMDAVKNSIQKGQSLADVAMAAGETIMTALTEMKSIAVAIESLDTTNDADAIATYQADFDALQTEIDSALAGANFDGQNLFTGEVTVKVNLNAAGSTKTIGNTTAVAVTVGTATSDNVKTAIDAFAGVMQTLGTDAKSLDRQLTFVTKLQDSLEAGIGNLVDADLAKESARLTALQTKQQLGVQALSIANQSSSILLGLFR